MVICTFNDQYINPLLEILHREANKITVLLGHFNIDLLNFDISDQYNHFS